MTRRRSDFTAAARRAVRGLVAGREEPGATAPVAAPREPRRRRFGLRPGPKLPPVPPVTDADSWLVPPTSQKEGIGHGFHAQGTGRRPRPFDVELLEELNEEYRHKPVVPEPRSWTAEGLAAEANRRVLWAHHTVDLAGKTVLEVGCGDGYELWSMAHNLGADAHGVDVHESARWADLAGDRVHLQRADLTQHNPLADDTFDRVVSYTVWSTCSTPTPCCARPSA
ncbi:class I SAM-dependent methyltransferase [Nocardioides aequoreus]|uniref:class I SAM-dependent methyltransferase n=1 Tax=Nocardioides aequoreus TaxID=397278 RepID=UPI0004C34370|nr:class I SAM-dependent methyltransferase [Nocardioides aequoreus]